MSPEIIDVQTNRRCRRTEEFGRLFEKRIKEEEREKEGGKQTSEDYETKTGEKRRKVDEEKVGGENVK